MSGLAGAAAPGRLAVAEPSAAELVARVAPEEYARLLGMPRGRPLAGDLAERADAARGWYARNGRPWVAARRLAIEAFAPAGVHLAGGGQLAGEALAGRLRPAEPHALAAFAVTAGAEAEDEARRLWQDDRPDESFFLDRVAAAVAEQLVRWTAAWICRQAEASGETALFHLSPGCGGWALEEQGSLMSLLFAGATEAGRPLRLLSSGMLSPGHSLLGILALARRAVAPSPADACRDCDLSPCGFRRAPYRGRA